VDTNVIAAFGSEYDSANAAAAKALANASKSGLVCASGAVFAELLGLPGRGPAGLHALFDSLGVAIEWDMTELDWETAGVAYEGYVARRRASGGGLPRLMLTDFLIGAHASVRGYTLLTADLRLYNAAFPGLRVIVAA